MGGVRGYMGGKHFLSNVQPIGLQQYGSCDMLESRSAGRESWVAGRSAYAAAPRHLQRWRSCCLAEA